VTADKKKLTLLCCQCGTEIDETQMFQYGGDAVACEKCMRSYYQDRPAEIELELQYRRRNAVAWVKRNRKRLENQEPKT
jgi:recombinational DNA repair protein (RecF pathway)